MKNPMRIRHWIAVGMAAVFSTVVLFYAFPPTPGRAFSKGEPIGGANHNRTPDNMLW